MVSQIQRRDTLLGTAGETILSGEKETPASAAAPSQEEGTVHKTTPSEEVPLARKRCEEKRPGWTRGPPNKQEPALPEEALWDTPRTAAFLNLAVSTLEKDRCLGHLNIPYVNTKRVAYRPSDVRAWVLSRRCRSTSEARS